MIYNKTSKGSIFNCEECKSIHIEFNNLNINFSSKEKYLFFAEHIHSIDGFKWADLNKDTSYTRKIMIPIGNGNCNFMLHPWELEDLKKLCTLNLFEPKFEFSTELLDYSLN